MAVHLFQERFEPGEHGVQGLLLPRKILPYERLKYSSVAVFRAPELGGLLEAPLDPGALLLAIPRRELSLEFGHGWLHRLHAFLGRQRGSGHDQQEKH